MNVNRLPSSPKAGLVAGSLIALACAAPLGLYAGDGELSEDINLIKLSVQGYDLDDSESSFQSALQHSKDGVYGIEELRFNKELSDSVSLGMNLKILPGDNTYDNVIKVVAEDKGSAEIGYTQFRTYYDGVGGFWPVEGAWKPLANQMLHVDRSKFWAGATLALPDKPVLSIKYTLERRYGDKDSTVWGETSDLGLPLMSNVSATTRKIAPGSIHLDEQVQSINASLTHTIGKTSLSFSVVGTFVDNLNSRLVTRYPGEVRFYPTPNPARSITWNEANNETTGNDIQGVESSTWAFIGKFETQLSSKVSLFGGISYADASIDYTGERLAYTSVRTGAGVLTMPGAYTGNGRPAYSFQDMVGTADHEVLTANFGVNWRPVRGLYLMAAIKGESLDTESSNNLTYVGTQYTQSTGAVTNKTAPGTNWSQSEEDVWIPELNVRYNGISGLSLYGNVDYRRSPGEEANYNTTVGTGFSVSNSEAADSIVENHLNGKLGLRWSPRSWVTLGAEGYVKNHSNSFTDLEELSTRFVLDTEYQGVTLNASLTPNPYVALTSRYIYREGTMETTVDNVDVYQSLDSTVHQLSQEITWSPTQAATLQAGITYVFDTAITSYPRAGGTANTLLHNADANYWNAHVVAGYSFSKETRAELRYVTYKADNYLPSLAQTSLPYGASQRDHQVTLGVKHKFSEQLAGEVKLGYFKSTNDTTGNYTGYEGLLGYLAITSAF